MRLPLTLTPTEPRPLSHIAEVIETRIPIYSIKAIVKLKVPRD